MGCGSIDSSDSKIVYYRRKCAIKHDKRMGSIYRDIMGYSSGVTETEKEKVKSLGQKYSEAQNAMAKSCYDCITDTANYVNEATCRTGAINAFKTAFDDDFANLA